MKLHGYLKRFILCTTGHSVNPPVCTVDGGHGKTVTFTTALDIHSLLPAVQLASQRERD